MLDSDDERNIPRKLLCKSQESPLKEVSKIFTFENWKLLAHESGYLTGGRVLGDQLVQEGLKKKDDDSFTTETSSFISIWSPRI